MLHEVFEGVLAFLETSAVWKDVGADDKEACLAVFVRDDLRLCCTIGVRVGRFDGPGIFFQLLEYDLDPKGVYIGLGH
jgi:hypothetical protein